MKNLFITLCFIQISSAILAQVEYDFNSKKYTNTSISKVKLGESVGFKILNINRFLYKATIGSQNYTYITDMPAEMQTIFRIKVEKDSSKKATDDVVSQMHKLNDNLATASAIKTEMNTLVANCDNYKNTINNIDQLVSDYQNLLNISRTRVNTPVQMGALLAGVTSALLSTNIAAVKQGFLQDYLAAKGQYQIVLAKAKASNLKTEEVAIDLAMKILEQNYEKLEAILNELEVKTPHLYNLLVDPNSFEINSLPIEAKGDEIEFSVAISEKDTKPEDIKPFQKTIKVKNGIKVDFSIGPMLSILGKKSQNDIPYWQKATDNSKDTTYNLLTSKASTKVSPSVMAMSHFSLRTASQFSIGILLGVGTEFKDLTSFSTNLATGISFILGKEQKFFISSGVNFKPVEVYQAYKYDKNIHKTVKSLDIKTLLEKEYIGTFFASMSYAIGKRSKVN